MSLKAKRFVQRTCAAAVCCALAVPALANPNAPTVVNGQATFQVNGKTLTVTNTPGTIINWQGFSISADELTRFMQQSPVSAVLNRVVGANPSEILGRLQSNGRVFLINPNGILFGAGSQVDVAGFVASTLNMSNADFLSGRQVFSGTGAEGKITNQGEIVTPAGGSVYLIAPQVENSGIIRAPSGEIVLAAGRTVRLVDSNFPSIQVEVSATDKDLPLGGLGAGKVFAYLVKHSGVVSASAASVGDGGRVVLKSAGEVQVAAVSRTEATGASGGTVAVQAAEKVLFSGLIDARGFVDKGGSVAIAAPTILIAYSGKVDVSGMNGGGRAVIVGQVTHFAGSIDAGAGRSGDGGFVEVSGRQLLAFTGTVDTRATAGNAGTLLFDPAQIAVIGGSTSMPAALADGTWASNEDPGAQSVGAVNVSNLLATTAVILQATEKIEVAADAVISSSGNALTLQAPTVLFHGTFRASAAANLSIQATTAQVTQGARIELAGGALNVAANATMVGPAQDAERLKTQAGPQRAAVVVSPEVARLRNEIAAEIERDNARLAAAMSQSCAKAGAPRQGCTVGGTAKRFSFAG